MNKHRNCSLLEDTKHMWYDISNTYNFLIKVKNTDEVNTSIG